MMKITWEGPVGERSGYGIASRNYARELMKIADVRVVSTTGRYPDMQMAESSKKKEEGRIHILHDFPLRPADVYYTVFEMDQAPVQWGKMLSKAKMVFTPSEHSRRALSSVVHDDEKIKIVHHGVDTDEFKPDGEKLNFYPSKGCKQKSEWIDKAYKFLYVAEWIERKRVQDLITTFCLTFTPSDPVCLILKVHSNHFPVKHLIRNHMVEGANIWLLGGKYESLAPVYRSCDCYVSTAACEGWGETLSEAMACGLPTIAGEMGGNTQFMTHDNSFLVPTRGETPIGHNILEPTIEPWFKYWPLDLNKLSECMSYVYKNRGEANMVAMKGLRDIRQFTWAKAAAEMLKYLEEL
jgi:glycosyltransferase involved in cell wall biosynthesis